MSIRTTVAELEKEISDLKSKFNDKISTLLKEQDVLKNNQKELQKKNQNLSKEVSELSGLITTLLKSPMLKNESSEDKLMKNIDLQSIEGDAARSPYVDNINSRIFVPQFENNFEFYEFYFQLKDVFASLGYANDFEKFENDPNVEISGPGSKILANYFTKYLNQKLDQETTRRIVAVEKNKFNYLDGFGMLRRFWTYTIGPFEDEFTSSETLKQIKFGETVNNIDVIKKIIKMIKLSEKMYDCSNITSEQGYLYEIADNISEDMRSKLRLLSKDKTGRRLEKNNFPSNFEDMEDLYSILALWEKQNTEIWYKVSNLFPGETALIHNVKGNEVSSNEEISNEF